MLKEDAELWVGLWINGGLKHGKENVLQHFAKVWYKVPASEDVTEVEMTEKEHHLPFWTTISITNVYYIQNRFRVLDKFKHIQNSNNLR